MKQWYLNPEKVTFFQWHPAQHDAAGTVTYGEYLEVVVDGVRLCITDDAEEIRDWLLKEMEKV